MEPTALQVLHDSATEMIREPVFDDDWDNGDTCTDHYVTGIKFSNDKYGDVYADWDIKKGDTCYLVYATYSTGCSFGHDENRCIEFFAVYKTEEKAKELVQKLENCDTWTMTYQTESGKAIQIHVPWLGYFESLNTATYEAFMVR